MLIAVNISTVMRLLSVGFMAYDFVLTIPSELRLYRRQRSVLALSQACKLFIAARYIGLTAVVAATAIFFSAASHHRCARLIPLSGALRAILSTVTSLVLLWRTWSIWSRSRTILLVMTAALLPTTMFSYGFLFDQRPFAAGGTCTALAGRSIFGHKWTFALANLLYDSLACVLSSTKLIQNIVDKRGLSKLSRILLSDGIGYFVLVATGHALNMAFLFSPNPIKQNAFLTFNVALTSILSQRIITSLNERAATAPARPHWTSSSSSTASSSSTPSTPSVFSTRSLASSMLAALASMPASAPPPPDVELGLAHGPGHEHTRSAHSARSGASHLVEKLGGDSGERGEVRGHAGTGTGMGARPIAVGVHTETAVAGDDASIFALRAMLESRLSVDRVDGGDGEGDVDIRR